MSALFVAGFAIVAFALVWDLVVPASALFGRVVVYLASAAAAACFVVVGGAALTGIDVHLDLHHVLALSAGGLSVDRLSGLFLVICFGVGVPIALAMAEWSRIPRRVRSRGLGFGFALVIGASAIVVTADNVFVLLFGWELLSFAFFVLAGVRRQNAGNARASILAMIFGKAGGALLLLGFLVLAGHGLGWQLASYTSVTGARHDIAYVLLFFGFGTKCGLVPVQIWLPPTYESAPGPARALMAGSAVNVGFYGLWRVLATLGRPPVWLVVVVLLVAAFTAILGIAHAAVQTRLLRVIAYSSIENAGLIVVGYGVALAGAATRDQRLVAVGLLAGTLQICTHAIAKSLLFTGAATIESASGTDDLDRLRGASRRSPFAAAGLGVGCLTLAGLPPTIGFVSEWFLLEALMQEFRLPGLALKLALAAAGALVALTAGFASVTFVRLFGFVVLGGDRGPTRFVDDARWPGKAAIVAMGAGCLAIAAITPLEVRLISAGLAPIVGPATTLNALKGPWVLQPVYASFSILSPSWLWVTLPTLSAAAVVFALVVTRARMLRVRRVPAWRSATAGVSGADRYTAFGYANPTRKLLTNVLLTRTEMRAIEARSDGHAGLGTRGVANTQLGYVSDVVEVVGTFVYAPLLRVLHFVVAVVKKLQSGRLDAYIAYMLVVLVAVLAVVTAFS